MKKPEYKPPEYWAEYMKKLKWLAANPVAELNLHPELLGLSEYHKRIPFTPLRTRSQYIR
jgi:hypothetical protein